MADYRPLVVSGTASNSVITELPTSSILIADGVRLGASALSISGHLELIGGLSGTPSVSSTAINSPAFTGGTFTGTSVSATDISSVGVSCVGGGGAHLFIRRDDGATYPNLIRATDGTITLQTEDDIHFKSNNGEDFARFNENAAVWLYHNDSKKIETHAGGAVVNGTLSATTGMESSGCPVPQPFGYMQLDSDGTDSVDETNLGAGATVTNIVSNTDHISWNDTAKYFNVSAAGVYEVLGVVILEGGSTLVDLSIQKNGSDVLVGQPRVHSTVDPLEHTIRAVFTCAASDYVSITYDATASNSVKAITGSTMSVKRLK
tara:strand:+ start:573 stop:1529 length:957 start_codon:yes stop_codon:yes gene_type:complete